MLTRKLTLLIFSILKNYISYVFKSEKREFLLLTRKMTIVTLTLVQAGDQFINYILQGFVWSDAQQRFRLVDLDVANGTKFA